MLVGASNIAILNVIMQRSGKVGSLWAEQCKKYGLYEKMLQIKVVRNSIF